MTTFKEKFLSRKFWITVAPIVSLFVFQYTGYALPAEVVVGVAGLAGAYVFGQGFVDAKTAEASINGATDVAKLQLMVAVEQLQAQVQELGAKIIEQAGVESNVVPIRPEITE